MSVGPGLGQSEGDARVGVGGDEKIDHRRIEVRREEVRHAADIRERVRVAWTQDLYIVSKAFKSTIEPYC